MLEKMLQDLEHIQEETKSQLKKVVSQEELNEIRVKFLGKKGELTAILKGMGKLNNEDRPQGGTSWPMKSAIIWKALLQPKQKN